MGARKAQFGDLSEYSIWNTGLVVVRERHKGDRQRSPAVAGANCTDARGGGGAISASVKKR